MGIPSNFPESVQYRNLEYFRSMESEIISIHPEMAAKMVHAPKLAFEDQMNSSHHCMWELNRFSVTNASEASGGQNYRDDYSKQILNTMITRYHSTTAMHQSWAGRKGLADWLRM